MSNDIILYDLPSKGRCAGWSLNPWKARLVLNFKNLPYKTSWVEYPDLASTFKSFGIEPNAKPLPEYTAPAARLSDGRYVMDSLEIARELERLHPEPSIHIDSPYMQRTADLLKDAFGGLRPIVLPRVPVMLLNPRSAEYFERTRAEIFSMPLSELEKSDQAGENGWKKAEVGFEGIKAMLEENNDGPYVLGKEVTFADFILAGLWTMLERVDRDGDVFGRTIGFDESFRRHYEACKGWLERDD